MTIDKNMQEYVLKRQLHFIVLVRLSIHLHQEIFHITILSTKQSTHRQE